MEQKMHLEAFLLIVSVNFYCFGARIKESENWEHSILGGDERVRNFKIYTSPYLQNPLNMYEEIDDRTPWQGPKFNSGHNNTGNLKWRNMTDRGWWNFAPRSHRGRRASNTKSKFNPVTLQRLKRFLKQSAAKGRFVSLNQGSAQMKTKSASFIPKAETKKSLRKDTAVTPQDELRGQHAVEPPPLEAMKENVDTDTTPITIESVSNGSVPPSKNQTRAKTYQSPQFAASSTQSWLSSSNSGSPQINEINSDSGTDIEINGYPDEPNLESETSPLDSTQEKEIKSETNSEITSDSPFDLPVSTDLSKPISGPVLTPQTTSPRSRANDLRRNNDDQTDDTDGAMLTLGVDLATNLCALQDEFDEIGNQATVIIPQFGSKYVEKYQLRKDHGCHAFKWIPCKKRGIKGKPCGWYELLPC